jgi:hypothetical protein
MSVVSGLSGNKVGAAIKQLHRAENDLARELLGVSDRHKADHEVYYGARDLARWSQEHVRRLATVGRDHEVDLDPEPAGTVDLISVVRQKGSELMGRQQAPGLLLLHDLRKVHVQTAGVSLDWEVLAQTAQVIKSQDLLTAASECHPQTLRQLRWSNALIKQLSPQVMASH